jgi:preprotein translocase subunit SecY
MFRAFINVFRIPDLRKKVGFTLLMLCVYRIGFYVPLPGVDQDKLARHWQRAGGVTEQAADIFAMFTGGDLGQSTLFGLGIMPYISASIIFQLLVTVLPSLEKLQKEGESGRRKIMEYTRYATVGLTLIQSAFWVRYLTANDLVYPDFRGTFGFLGVAMTGLMAGTLLLMWVGEQIDEYGIGNGISLIIMAGIISRLPYVLTEVANGLIASMRGGGTLTPGMMTPEKIVFLIVSFVAVVAGSILITQAQRRIKIQQAKQTRGRRIVGGAQHYLPLRVNHGGVMPIIFASSFLLFPGMIFRAIYTWGAWPVSLWGFLQNEFHPGRFIYELSYVLMVYFFAYFWVSVQFQPKELANNLRDMGSFIPGLRPGKRTADYLEAVMTRITYVGAGFLAIIALIPSVVAVYLEIPYRISAFLGGTGLLIVVSVTLDLIQRIEANLIMRNYEGFLGAEGGGRVKGRQY